jgi:misacylated tRNA(Ala) deacylase
MAAEREIRQAADRDTSLRPSRNASEDDYNLSVVMNADRLYLSDPYVREFDAVVRESHDGGVVLSQTAFYPGGGGQPSDVGLLEHESRYVRVLRAHEDDVGKVWHTIDEGIPAGAVVRGLVNWQVRYAHMRYHCLLHVVNAVAYQRHRGLVTGAQIESSRARVDLSVENFSRSDVDAFEEEVNVVVQENLLVNAASVSESELTNRPDLVRTLKVRPPVVNGMVRIVEIETFDAQACGGTHVHTTGEIGRARLVKFDNRGKNNKRFYWELE